MEADTIVTFDDNEKYYLADETVQNNQKYFLGNKLDENEEPTLESVIFKESVENGETYLEELTSGDEHDYISAVFLSNYNDSVNKEEA